MAVYPIPTLLTRISTYITTNGTKDITGAVMQSILTDVVDSLNAIIGAALTLEDVLNNGNDANGLDINLNGTDASLTSAAGFGSTINALLYATGLLILKSDSDVVNMRNNADFDLAFSLSGLTASRQWTIQDKPIIVAGLDDIANALADYLKLDGTTPMTGDLDMLTNGVAVRTDDIKTSLGVLDLIYGADKLSLDFSAISGGLGSYLQTFRAKAGIVAHLDDIPHSYQFAASDETTALVADGTTPVYTDYIAVPITVNSVMISVNTAPIGADNIIVDIHKNGTSIFSTLISIDATENTSLTAATPYVLDGTIAFAQGDKIECFINQVGSTVAGAGLKVKLIQ